jgi:arylsulfatase
VPDPVQGRSALPLVRGDRTDLRPYLHGEHVLLGQSLQW